MTLATLPRDVLVVLLSFLHPKEAIASRLLCRGFREPALCEAAAQRALVSLGCPNPSEVLTEILTSAKHRVLHLHPKLCEMHSRFPMLIVEWFLIERAPGSKMFVQYSVQWSGVRLYRKGVESPSLYHAGWVMTDENPGFVKDVCLMNLILGVGEFFAIVEVVSRHPPLPLVLFDGAPCDVVDYENQTNLNITREHGRRCAHILRERDNGYQTMLEVDGAVGGSFFGFVSCLVWVCFHSDVAGKHTLEITRCNMQELLRIAVHPVGVQGEGATTERRALEFVDVQAEDGLLSLNIGRKKPINQALFHDHEDSHDEEEDEDDDVE
jgi:hypothetical protein